MVWVFFFYVLLLGSAIGSFLNVVVLRFNTGRTLAGRSACLTCAAKLSWYDLVPVFSFFVLRGRCRSCRSKISWQYPLVELAAALIYFSIAWQFLHSGMGTDDILLLLFSIVSWPLLLAILVYDARHKVIPDPFVYGFTALTLLFRVLLGFLHGFDSYFLADLLAGPLLFIPFYLLWRLSGGRWMGLGDGKLALGLGFAGGLGGGISAIVLGFWFGAAVGLVLIAASRFRGSSGLSMKSELPFGPFLIAGLFAVQFFGFSLFNIGF